MIDQSLELFLLASQQLSIHAVDRFLSGRGNRLMDTGVVGRCVELRALPGERYSRSTPLFGLRERMRYDYLVRLFGGELRHDYIERRYGKAIECFREVWESAVGNELRVTLDRDIRCEPMREPRARISSTTSCTVPLTEPTATTMVSASSVR